jgi:hypothetical protein
MKKNTEYVFSGRVITIGEKKEGFSVERTGDKRATTENVQRS